MPPKSVLFHHLGIRKEKMPLPYFIQLEPTTKCNFSCVMCTRKKLSKSRLNQELTLEDFRYIIKQLPTLIKVKLQGYGEPFLCSELHDILSFGRENGISFTTTTNGSLLHKNLDLVKFFDEIIVSIDTTDE